ncbi:phosphate acyltransferase PlsX [Streptosporangium roseum]|uniref:Phosphate acyltransferase n=1 Tax=Streptosporangium roseum (strain ATCC 12428 / DSM 43021 / JCM 3005 / KCTC 9067 / NCIMB 10171 / NRRL 2505 / NI 9100) TaxID=479432 RepID=D2ATM8_STRRD|nr:phosphate acyltransferase PlsX [Streptosporangium roseum]ACZ86748.1 phosphate:acyl-(acyl carrier protein) acyltransferase [Streptosporangium roseum DSM 43021]
MSEPVVVDAMGGDHGPAETVGGAVMARREHGVPVVLVGRAGEIRAELARHGAVGEVDVVHAEEVVPMGERGAGAVASGASSLRVGCELLRQGAGSAFVSAGSTGAVVSCAIRGIGRAPAVLRPALAIALPSVTGGATVLIDAGATSDPTPEMIAQFALLGVSYARLVLGVADPSVGLLSIGSEPGKGNRLTRRVEELLPGLPLRFHGNVEGHDVLAGTVDVIVTDGFTGNIVLKNVEGSVRAVLTLVARSGAAGPEALRGVARRYDPETHGGAALLGLSGTVVVAHGSSRAATITRACVVAHDLAGGGIVPGVPDRLAAEPVT